MKDFSSKRASTSLRQALSRRWSFMAKSPAWQRKEGKNPKGGLNAKGRASYNRANPGKPGLKAPQPEGGPRKKSFCARMSGMKKKLTSAKTANDPNSRINKSLRAWKCCHGDGDGVLVRHRHRHHQGNAPSYSAPFGPQIRFRNLHFKRCSSSGISDVTHRQSFGQSVATHRGAG